MAFEAKLPSSMYPGVAARKHFQEANRQLLDAMNGDAGLAKMVPQQNLWVKTLTE